MNRTDRILGTVLAASLLLACGGCRQTWRFAAAEYPTGGLDRAVRPASARPSMPGGRQDDLVRQAAGYTSPPVANIGPPVYSPADSAPRSRHDIVYQFADDPGQMMPLSSPLPDTRFQPATPVSYSQTSLPVSRRQSAAPVGCRGRLKSNWREFCGDVRCDYRNYYSWSTLRDLSVAVALASPLANSSIDDDIHDWYQRDVRSSGTDSFASFWKTFGEGEIFVPAFACLAVAGGLFEDRPIVGRAGDYGDRVTRGYLVGAPPMLLMQAMLGGSRPGEVTVASNWKPLDDTNAVSGHAFMGAVPFITAAKMAENNWVKGTLYACSTFTAWSRVNDDDHYFSQICLGWWMAYLACRSVDETESGKRRYTLAPIATPEMSGIGLVIAR